MAVTERFDRALNHALQLHREQCRKGSGIPYFSHLMAVSGLVWEHGGDEEQAIAALLHDAVEDQGGGTPESQRRMLAELEREYGPRITRIVANCSDSVALGKHAPWHERKRQYIAHLAQTDQDTLLVSLADKMHNGTTILHDLHATAVEGREPASFWSRFQRGMSREGIAETIGYYRALADVFLDRGPIGRAGVLESEFAGVVDRIVDISAVDPDLGWLLEA